MIPKTKSTRLLALDYLRGYFIVVIIVDHLSRWPSLLGLISGKALLWVTAAEGFIIISGLLIGYVRGYKNRKLPFADITKKLLKRAGLLYLWSIIGSIVYVAIIWYVPLKGGAPGTPIEVGNWSQYLHEVTTVQYTFVWVHFLTLYAVFLAASPIAVWLIRKNKAWLIVVLSLLLLAIGWQIDSELLQWQALFFIPSAVGAYIDPLRSYWSKLPARKRNLATLAIALSTSITVILSVICTFYPAHIQQFADFANNLFAKDTISLWRLGLAFLWFTGFLLLFSHFEKWLSKYLGWLLLPIGTHSLTAYILHGLTLCLVSYFTVSSDSVIINTLLGAICIILVWLALKSRAVLAVIPS